jgi:hypothetical protein
MQESVWKVYGLPSMVGSRKLGLLRSIASETVLFKDAVKIVKTVQCR